VLNPLVNAYYLSQTYIYILKMKKCSERRKHYALAVVMRSHIPRTFYPKPLAHLRTV